MPYLINGKLLEFGNREQIRLLNYQRINLISFLKLLEIDEIDWDLMKEDMCDTWLERFKRGEFHKIFQSEYKEEVLEYLSDWKDLTYHATKILWTEARRKFNNCKYLTLDVKIEKVPLEQITA